MGLAWYTFLHSKAGDKCGKIRTGNVCKVPLSLHQRPYSKQGRPANICLVRAPVLTTALPPSEIQMRAVTDTEKMQH